MESDTFFVTDDYVFVPYNLPLMKTAQKVSHVESEVHLYCLARWLRKLGAGLQERAAVGSATCRSVFTRRAPSACRCSGAGAPGAADVADAGRIPRETLSRRARTRPTEVRARVAAPPPPQRRRTGANSASTLTIHAEPITIITQISFCHTLFLTRVLLYDRVYRPCYHRRGSGISSGSIV